MQIYISFVFTISSWSHPRCTLPSPLGNIMHVFVIGEWWWSFLDVPVFLNFLQQFVKKWQQAILFLDWSCDPVMFVDGIGLGGFRTLTKWLAALRGFYRLVFTVFNECSFFCNSLSVALRIITCPPRRKWAYMPGCSSWWVSTVEAHGVERVDRLICCWMSH